jgi:hypothetical protein
VAIDAGFLLHFFYGASADFAIRRFKDGKLFHDGGDRSFLRLAGHNERLAKRPSLFVESADDQDRQLGVAFP